MSSVLASMARSWRQFEDDSGTAGYVAAGAVKGGALVLLPSVVLERGPSLASVRRSVALATFVALSRLLSRLGQTLSLPSLVRHYWGGLTGVAAALAAVRVEGSVESRRLLVVWLLLRAVRVLIPSKMARDIAPWGAVATMAIASSRILTVWIFAPQHLHSSFASFLNLHGGQRVSDIRLYRLAEPPLPSHCFTVHPGLDCHDHFLRFFLAAAVRAVKLYAPLHLVLVLASSKRSLLRYGRALGQSTLFLALYCALAWRSACLFYQSSPGVTSTKLMLPTLAVGLSTLAERGSRQSELALYVLSYAVDSVLSELGHGQRMRLSLPALLASIAVLFHHRQLPAIVQHGLLGLS